MTAESLSTPTLALSRIRVEEGFNPRAQLDADKVKEIAASMRQVGCLTPIMVRPDGQDYVVVAGHQRFAAAQLAELADVPVTVSDVDEVGALSRAIIENLHRSDLNPIDEARGFARYRADAGIRSVKQLATVLGKRQAFVTERLKLLDLPESTQEHIAAGAVPLSVVPTLLGLMGRAPKVAEVIGDSIASGSLTATEVTTRLDNVLRRVSNLTPDERGFFVAIRRGYSSFDRDTPAGYSIQEFPTGFVDDDLLCRFQAIEQEDLLVEFGPEELAEWLAYGGALIKLGEDTDSYGPQATYYLTDPAYALERFKEKLPALEEQLAQEIANRQDEERDEHRALEAGTTTPAEKRVQQQEAALQAEELARKAERQQREEHRKAAITANRELGRALGKKLGAASLTRPVALLLANLVVASNSQLGRLGVRYVNEEWQRLDKRVRKSDGFEKWSLSFTLSNAEADLTTYEWITRPKKPDEILGRLLQALIAAWFADQKAVVNSEVCYWHRPHLPYEWGGREQIVELIEKIAKPILPPHFKRQLDERDELARQLKDHEDVAAASRETEDAAA